MCEMGILVAAAIILDLPFLKFKVFANGGSITFAMLPLFILALRQGPFKGFIGAGIIFGCIDCLIDGEPIASIPLDYLVGYGSAAIVGFTELVYKGKVDVKKYIFCGLFCLAATFVRLVGGTLSGMFLWETPFVESLVYNATYIVPTGLFALVGLLLLLKPNEQIGRPDR